jgi:phage terminase small subunit
MARPGRKPLPASVIRLHGNRSKLSKEELAERERSEVRPNPVSPKRPRNLSPHERMVWDLHVEELDRLGLLTVLDGLSFRLLVCQPGALALTAWEAMRPSKADGSPDARRREPQVVRVDSRGDLRRHPAFIVWKQAAAEYRAGCQEFGLTPSARVGLRPSAPIGTVADDDDDTAFFGA